MTTDAVGGVWTYAIDLSEGLIDAGVAVTLAILGPAPSASQLRQLQSIEGLGYEIVPGPLDWTAQAEAPLRAVAAEVARLAQASGADVVHLNSPALAGLGRFDRPVVGVCHSCVASWWRAVRQGELPDDLRWRHAVLARGYAACDALIAPSQTFAEITSEVYGVRPIAVLNGRRASSVAPRSGERFALTAGRLWDAAKDVATLDRAASLVDAPVVALGALAGPDGETIVLRHIEASGAVDAAAAADWMARAPVFVSTARYEPFGLAVLEAAQAGAALVLADIPTFRELWNGAAIFVTPGEAGDFALAIQGLLQNEPALNAARAAAKRRAEDYSSTAMTSATMAQYVRLDPRAFARAARIEAAA